MTIQVTVNPNIGCKYPGTCNDTLVRSMATIIRAAANMGGTRQFQQRNYVSQPDPDEGHAKEGNA